MMLTFQKFLGMCHHELLQTQNVQISRWLLYLQGKVKQVSMISTMLRHICHLIVSVIKTIFLQLTLHGQWQICRKFSWMFQNSRKGRGHLQCLCPHCQKMEEAALEFNQRLVSRCGCKVFISEGKREQNCDSFIASRSGPGTKPVVRPKRGDDEENLKYKHVYKRKNPLVKARTSSAPRKRENSESSNRSESPPTVPEVSPTDQSLYPAFLDATYWKR